MFSLRACGFARSSTRAVPRIARPLYRHFGSTGSSGGGGGEKPLPLAVWIHAKDKSNPYPGPILDCNPLTSTLISSSKDPKCAENASSYSRDSDEYGAVFLNDFQSKKASPHEKWVSGDCALRFRRDRFLADGIMYLPQVMEDKWFVCFHDSKILFVRSWLRKLEFVAHVKQSRTPYDAASPSDTDFLDIVGWEGVDSTESPRPHTPRWHERSIDFLLRSFVCGEYNYPAPMKLGLIKPRPPHTEIDPLNYEASIDHGSAGMLNWSYFGRAANYCTPAIIEPRAIPATPLRSLSKAFYAMRDKRYSDLDKHVADGHPIDLRTRNGTTFLSSVALGQQSAKPGESVTATAEHLLKSGHPVDARDWGGGTPLMSAVLGIDWLPREKVDPIDIAAAESKGLPPPVGALKPPPLNGEYSHIAHMKLLIKNGANVNAKDLQGFTALHRAAVHGNAMAARVLLDAGADKRVEAVVNGKVYTPLSCARDEQQLDVAKLLQ